MGYMDTYICILSMILICVMNFDISSAGGILLFRETSNILKAYGGNILNKRVTDESRKWHDRYKGITLCL